MEEQSNKFSETQYLSTWLDEKTGHPKTLKRTSFENTEESVATLSTLCLVLYKNIYLESSYEPFHSLNERKLVDMNLAIKLREVTEFKKKFKDRLEEVSAQSKRGSNTPKEVPHPLEVIIDNLLPLAGILLDLYAMQKFLNDKQGTLCEYSVCWEETIIEGFLRLTKYTMIIYDYLEDRCPPRSQDAALWEDSLIDKVNKWRNSLEE
ncbi:hypothetical protein BDV25DRAFT_138238 [Aspergillus avenaceus]|uniref:Uncharacterized protein n=1 Tax=Aspergillus avenaceus TaxID=36643 RepID=A0A5N6U0J1_ASPAV|nr:hypothetical protein BDV25DRAFT_138238 [Aspergillus avenaceus]